MPDLPFGLTLSPRFPFVRRVEAEAAPLQAVPGGPAPRPYVRTTGSLSRRMILIAAAWIALLLAGGGGFALDRVLTDAITRNFDDGLKYILTSLIVSAEIDPEGQIAFNYHLSDQRFLEPYSGA